MTESRFPNAPDRIAALPVDHRGFPIPWFVAWQDGKPVFPAMDPEKMAKAIKDSRCWVCGQPLGRYKVYVVGPMCIANRVSSEPPSHLDCARFAAENCPFLANPNMKRVPIEKYEGTTENVAGIMIPRNPGVTAVATCEGPLIWHRDGPGVLFDVAPIISVEWFDSGLPILRDMAAQEGPAALAHLAECEASARALFPVAA
jgi:ferredoxin